MPATESADNDVEGRLSFREGNLPPLALNLSKPPLPPPVPVPLPFPFFPFAPSGKLFTSGMPELRLFKVNSSAEEPGGAAASAEGVPMPPPSWFGVDGEKCRHAPSPAPDGRFRPNLAPMRLSIPLPPPGPNCPNAAVVVVRAGLSISPLLPPRVGVVVFFCLTFFFPPKPIAADTDAVVLVAVAAAVGAVVFVVALVVVGWE